MKCKVITFVVVLSSITTPVDVFADDADLLQSLQRSYANSDCYLMEGGAVQSAIQALDQANTVFNNLRAEAARQSSAQSSAENTACQNALNAMQCRSGPVGAQTRSGANSEQNSSETTEGQSCTQSQVEAAIAALNAREVGDQVPQLEQQLRTAQQRVNELEDELFDRIEHLRARFTQINAAVTAASAQLTQRNTNLSEIRRLRQAIQRALSTLTPQQQTRLQYLASTENIRLLGEPPAFSRASSEGRTEESTEESTPEHRRDAPTRTNQAQSDAVIQQLERDRTRLAQLQNYVDPGENLRQDPVTEQLRSEYLRLERELRSVRREIAGVLGHSDVNQAVPDSLRAGGLCGLLSGNSSNPGSGGANESTSELSWQRIHFNDPQSIRAVDACEALQTARTRYTRAVLDAGRPREHVVSGRIANSIRSVTGYAQNVSRVIQDCRSLGAGAVVPLVGTLANVVTQVSGASATVTAAVGAGVAVLESLGNAIVALFRGQSPDERALVALQAARVPLALRCALQKYNQDFCIAQRVVRDRDDIRQNGSSRDWALMLTRVHSIPVCMAGMDTSGFSLMSTFVQGLDQALQAATLPATAQASQSFDNALDRSEQSGGTFEDRIGQVLSYLDNVINQIQTDYQALVSESNATSQNAVAHDLQAVSQLVEARTRVAALHQLLVTRRAAINNAQPRAGVSATEFRAAASAYRQVVSEQNRIAREAVVHFLERQSGSGLSEVILNAMRMQREPLRRIVERTNPTDSTIIAQRREALAFLSSGGTADLLTNMWRVSLDGARAQVSASTSSVSAAYEAAAIRLQTLEAIGSRVSSSLQAAITNVARRANDQIYGAQLEGLCMSALCLQRIPDEIVAGCSSFIPFQFRRQPTSMRDDSYQNVMALPYEQRRCWAYDFLERRRAELVD